MILKIISDRDVQKFNQVVPKHEVVIAGFFMVNCPACEAFEEPWADFINDCKKKNDPGVLIAAVDSNQASKVKFDTSALEGFPSVFRDVKGEQGIVEFKKNRTREDLHEFLREAMAKKGGKKLRKRKPRKRKPRKRKTSKRKTRKRKPHKRTRKRTKKKRR